MITKDYLLIISRKKNRSSLFSSDFEIKRVFSVFEMNSCSRNRKAKVCQGVDRKDTILGNLKAFVFCINDLEGEVIEGKSMESEYERLGDRTGGFDVVIIFACVLEVESDGSSIFGGARHPVARGGEGRDS